MPSPISPLELDYRYLAFLDLERKLLAHDLGLTRDGKITVYTDRKVERFFEPLILKRGRRPIIHPSERAEQMLQTAGISLRPDHFLFD